ncbi:type VI secretion system-associated protein TagF [Kangiella shandongensis]|uniref:type VI secretion system-associated protein TagF n=1 Tax=Kangiella shandongensis TaxID=2763258 RepID=UPI001CBA9155|nr:type VI secretion system-associated protein TagF [Kangiella shandongensis]
MSEQLIEDQATGKIACFGKIRAKGDFISRNLDYDVQEYLDGWLQSAFNTSQEQIGEDWLKFYLTSPIWRFVISDPKLGKDIVGFMMPSIDKVGRYYPLFMLEVFADGQLCGDELHCKSFAELEELAMSTLDDGEDSLTFFESLNQSGFPLFEERPPVSELLQRLSVEDAVVDDETMKYLWHESSDFEVFEFEQFSTEQLRGIWWTEGSSSMDKALVYCEGLPPVAGFSAMLDGDWQRWGWQEKINKEEEQAFAAE